jgi:tungstate transport system ATP-binding protein
MTDSNIIYEINGITKKYSSRPALSIDRLTFPPSSITGVIGHNGSGKSTLLKILGLIEKPTTGSIHYKGCDVSQYSTIIRYKITLLSQQTHLLRRNVYSNIIHGLKYRKDTKKLKERAFGALESVGLNPSEFINRNWDELSGGEAQRVALAARLILKPSILLMDEPTANVDYESSRLIQKAILNAKHHWGATIVIASHDSDWLNQCCDRIIRLFNGSITEPFNVNIVSGPFIKWRNGYYKKNLPDTQILVVPEPPSQKSYATLSPKHFSLFKTQEKMQKLEGIVKKIESTNGNGLTAMIRTGFLDLQVEITGVDKYTACLPGEKVTVFYSPEKTGWL